MRASPAHEFEAMQTQKTANRPCNSNCEIASTWSAFFEERNPAKTPTLVVARKYSTLEAGTCNEFDHKMLEIRAKSYIHGM
jgi:hypothetical protein